MAWCHLTVCIRSLFNCQTAKRNRPLSLSGRGGSPVVALFFRPPVEGDGAPRWRPGYPGCPVGSGLIETHLSPDAPAPLGAPRRYLSAFAFLGARTMRGLLPASLLRGPLGGEVTTHAREYRIPPHPGDVSRGRPSMDGTGHVNISGTWRQGLFSYDMNKIRKRECAGEQPQRRSGLSPTADIFGVAAK